MNSTHISYSQRSGTTAESEVAALSNVFKFVLDCPLQKKRRSPKTTPTTEPRPKEIPPMRQVYPIEDDSREILPMVRELFSRRPETRCLEAWELQHVLYSLNYTDGLADEAEIAAAIEIGRTDYDPDEGAE